MFQQVGEGNWKEPSGEGKRRICQNTELHLVKGKRVYDLKRNQNRNCIWKSNLDWSCRNRKGVENMEERSIWK